MRVNPLSVTLDIHGHTIERYEGDTLKIYDTNTHRPVDLATHAKVSAWFWRHVSATGNDPEPQDKPITPTDNTTNDAGWPIDPADPSTWRSER